MSGQGDLIPRQRLTWPALSNVLDSPLPTAGGMIGSFALMPTGAHESWCTDGAGYVIAPGEDRRALPDGQSFRVPFWSLWFVPRPAPTRRPWQPRPQCLTTGYALETLMRLAREHCARRAEQAIDAHA